MPDTILEGITSPSDIKSFDFSTLESLAEEIRIQLIKTISKNGGHLASNLGTVELTLALHKIFTCPTDQIVWDVGHQSYTHKLLTGRQKQFSTIRLPEGLSGFPRHSESTYDAFVAGHSSTSISVAEGLVRAKQLQQKPGWVIVVVGDGAFTGGMIYEALNNVRKGDRLAIILNDNGMSISRNVGALAGYIAKIRTNPRYFRVKDKVELFLKYLPLIGVPAKEFLMGLKRVLRQKLYHSNLFEYFGLEYYGPVDGHNLRQLCDVFQRVKNRPGPVFIHVQTVKGKGYPYAEQSPQAFHGVSGFDIATGNPEVAHYDSYSTIFGKELVALAREDPSICAITAAMETGTGLQYFSREFKGTGRFFDVGIAEPHAVTFAAGLAANGMKPVFAVYSTFLQRAVDQLIHDAAIEHQHVVIAVDRAGIVGDDGETHQGVFDVALVTPIPGVVVYSPASFEELKYSLHEAFHQNDGPCVVRYPRGSQPPLKAPFCGDYSLYYPETVQADGFQGVTLATYGREASVCEMAADVLAQKGVSVRVIRLVKIHPLPKRVFHILAKSDGILFVEEGIQAGGVGEQLMASLCGYNCGQESLPMMKILAIQDRFVPQDTVQGALKRVGLDQASVEKCAEQIWKAVCGRNRLGKESEL
jgi:1-deoxy-D-xylulose-5-phosphate synthase